MPAHGFPSDGIPPISFHPLIRIPGVDDLRVSITVLLVDLTDLSHSLLVRPHRHLTPNTPTEFYCLVETFLQVESHHLSFCLLFELKN